MNDWIFVKNASWVFIPRGRINYEGMGCSSSVFPSALIGFRVPPPKNIQGHLLSTEEPHIIDEAKK